MYQRPTFKHFQFWGIGFGGIVPISVFGICAYAFGIAGLMVVKWAPACIGISTVVLITLSFVLYYHEEQSGETRWFGLLFKFQALLCFVLVHLVVKFTGGSRGSVFAFTCLYVPSVVGYVYGKKGPNFKGASIAMLLIYVLNLFWPQDLLKIPPNQKSDLTMSSAGLTTSIPMEFFYLGVFVFQLIALAVMAAQKPQLKDPDPGT